LRIALVTCRFSYATNFDRLAARVLENIGLEYVAGALAAEGFEVRMFNQELLGLDTEALVDELNDGEYALVGFSANTSNVAKTLSVARRVRRGALVCIGGYSATLHPSELIRRAGVDAIVSGEGEGALVELARAVRDGAPREGIPGLTTRQGQSPPRQLAGLDALPRPLRLDLDALSRRPVDSRVALVSTTRGCTRACSFCYIKRFYSTAPGPARRCRDPIDVVDEIEELLGRDHAPSYIYFVDDDFIGANRRRALTIGQEILRRRLELAFEFDCTSTSVDQELFEVLKEAGLRTVFVGVESFSQTALDRLSKRARVEDNLHALRVLRELGIRPILGIIHFDPGTSLTELRETVPFLKEFGFENVNDPCRILKEYPRAQILSHRRPRDEVVRRICDALMDMSERLCGDILERGRWDLADLAAVKTRVGEELERFVS
jgi:anaerobic magnesium-protoporphyrin IX monomethyl ester cyclase